MAFTNKRAPTTHPDNPELSVVLGDTDGVPTVTAECVTPWRLRDGTFESDGVNPFLDAAREAHDLLTGAKLVGELPGRGSIVPLMFRVPTGHRNPHKRPE